MFSLIVELSPRSEYIDRLEKLLQTMTQAASSENGILHYSVHRPNRPADTFVLCEIYRDRMAWADHLKIPRIRSALKEFESLLEKEPKVIQCNVVSTSCRGEILPNTP